MRVQSLLVYLFAGASATTCGVLVRIWMAYSEFSKHPSSVLIYENTDFLAEFLAAETVLAMILFYERQPAIRIVQALAVWLIATLLGNVLGPFKDSIWPDYYHDGAPLSILSVAVFGALFGHKMSRHEQHNS